VGFRFPSLDIIKPEEGAIIKSTIIKGNWTGTLGQDSFRCTIGLILSHYGWTGYSCSSTDYEEADYKLHELISTEEQRIIASINDSSESYDVVIERLERSGRNHSLNSDSK
jgi:hypothetical protein